MLSDLERDNLFLVPLDSQRSWYRYHHLFADVLHARLLDRGPRPGPAAAPAGQRLVRRAGPRRGRRPARAGRGGLPHGPPTWWRKPLPEVRRARQDSQLLAWIRALPDAVVRPSPVLNIVAGWALMMTGDLDGLESRLDDADAALAAGSRDPDLAATWAGHRRPAHRSRDRPGLPGLARPGAGRRRRDGAPRASRARPGRPRGPLRARWRRRVPRPGRLVGRGRRRRPSPRSPRRCAACTPRGTWSTSWTPP